MDVLVQISTKDVPRNTKDLQHATLIKFVAPHSLKETLSEMALERSVSLSALLRIIASEYIKHDQKT